MDIQIQKYSPANKQSLVELMETLQDYIIAIDPLHRHLRLSNYGEVYTDSLIQKIQEGNGTIFVAKQDSTVVGCIAGIIIPQSEEEKVGMIPSQRGRILELVVIDKLRHQGIGAALMNRMEDYFLKRHCDSVIVEVFVPNTIAHDFYAKLHYGDRTVDMIKRL